MRCYTCETTNTLAGALSSASIEAIGVCHNCGVGLCLAHASRPSKPGSPLLCQQCARRPPSSRAE
jgi:hypothetical protein